MSACSDLCSETAKKIGDVFKQAIKPNDCGLWYEFSFELSDVTSPRFVQFTCCDVIERCQRSSSCACEPRHAESVRVCCFQTTQHQHMDIWATCVDSFSVIPIIGILFVDDHISQ